MVPSKSGGQRKRKRGELRGFIYLTSVAVWEQPEGSRKMAMGSEARAAATIINGMRPQTIGRTLGIGLRIAGRVAGQRLAASAQTAASAPAQQQAAAAAQSRATGKTAGKVTRGLGRGVGGFLRPFTRVGGILWLEVTGVFFFLPVLVFSPKLWQLRASWRSGPGHSTFLVTAGIVALFFYLGVSSFWRARKR
jgi:hypothetical protein